MSTPYIIEEYRDCEVKLAGSRTGSIWQKIINLICTWICPKAYPCHQLPQLIYSHINALRECFEKERRVVVWDYQKLIEVHRKYFGDKVPIIVYDMKYAVPDLKTVNEVIRLDWTNYYHYIQSLFDCDDYARVFKAHCMEIFRINAIGYVVGEVRDKNTNQLLGYHAFNVVVTSDEKIYMYEPQNDMLVEVKDGKGYFGKYIYIPYWVEY